MKHFYRFEAFVVALERLDMVLKHETTLEMYREVDSTKDGFLQVEEFSKLLTNICHRGMWQSAFQQFPERYL